MVFRSPHGDLEQAQPQRRELHQGEIASGRDGLPHCRPQPWAGVCSTANLVGHGPRQGVRSEASLVLYNLVKFAAWLRAQYRLVEMEADAAKGIWMKDVHGNQ
ncbi:hypothetical protein AJ87_08355 [Rhizobium yanglingense]|nr:hypothetical protein AJ87_08355 [Rhizobium yanglingense]